jgi:uncharacterized protein YbaR (Trm112 family)
MIRKEFLDLLRCPLDHGPLCNAGGDLVNRLNTLVTAGRLRNRAGDAVTRRIDGGLINQSSTILYPVRGEIPCLLVDEAIPLDQLESV